jgi:hypothetical protein
MAIQKDGRRQKINKLIEDVSVFIHTTVPVVGRKDTTRERRERTWTGALTMIYINNRWTGWVT